MNTFEVFDLSTGTWLCMSAAGPLEALSNAYEFANGNANTWEYKEKFENNKRNIVTTDNGAYLGTLGILLRKPK